MQSKGQLTTNDRVTRTLLGWSLSEGDDNTMTHDGKQKHESQRVAITLLGEGCNIAFRFLEVTMLRRLLARRVPSQQPLPSIRRLVPEDLLNVPIPVCVKIETQPCPHPIPFMDAIRKVKQSSRFLGTVKVKAIPRDGFQFARLLSTSSEGVSSNDKGSSTEAPKHNGVEASNGNSKKQTETAAKADPDATTKVEEKAKAGEDVIKSEAAEKKLQDLLKETQALLKEKDKEVVQAKQQVLTHLAEVENVRGRTRRNAESIKQHAMETFATDLLDMADNLSRAAANVPEHVRTEASDTDMSTNAKLLKSLLVGVDMTQKQLMKIFNKFGVQKYDPIGETYDPQSHLAITEVEDETKEPQTIVNIVKSGYFFKEKLIRPAEVDIVKKRAETK
ncbi:hypothetical protein GOP47_0013815 [Adiantum capillus-veneris]|uniref:GrpE protein homolog n=1 Tax=Adiantum capillus-veneris TaxID=13818 RepID=A0A9D4UPR6_ADICA|nr:hypothetical protein GOP47_0013815 [Adiantum capillus-veneris]